MKRKPRQSDDAHMTRVIVTDAIHTSAHTRAVRERALREGALGRPLTIALARCRHFLQMDEDPMSKAVGFSPDLDYEGERKRLDCALAMWGWTFDSLYHAAVKRTTPRYMHFRLPELGAL